MRVILCFFFPNDLLPIIEVVLKGTPYLNVIPCLIKLGL